MPNHTEIRAHWRRVVEDQSASKLNQREYADAAELFCDNCAGQRARDSLSSW